MTYNTNILIVIGIYLAVMAVITALIVYFYREY